MRHEAEYALRLKESDLDPPEIKPVILERPPPLPWPELASIHFDDRVVYLMETPS